ncbi:ovalbumin-related protein X-like [Chrysoperla carnea]|uniref:ovalbumin-related protein X-like n=1 Tax=Chrysoperla carnea TaxID=189513 RepID=UPI001D0688ED|nr:ovalbumin-related protein X-like [Chrysoperla carnea]
MDLCPQQTIDEENHFTFLLYNAICSKDGNIVICPISINIMLAVIYLGSSDETSLEIEKLLKLKSSDKSQIAECYTNFLKQFDHLKEISLNIINKIYIKNDYELLDVFKETAGQYFYTEIETVNFTDPNILSKINHWITEKTNQRLKSVIDSICPNDIMLIINTIYFNALWENEFNISKHSIEFQINETEIIEVPHLFRKDFFNYYCDPETKLKILEIPYKDEQFSFVLFLPKDVNDWKDFDLSKINYKGKLEENLVKVSIPMFKIEQSHDLTCILQELGMKTAFNNSANLTEMAKPHQEPLKISKIIQKNSIIVSEKGTEASTASPGIIKMKLSSSETFNADHPFFFLIQHKPTNSILYIGRVVNPNI